MILCDVILNIRGLLFLRRCQGRKIKGTRTKLVLQYTACLMYKVNYNGRASYVINYFYYRMPWKDCFMFLRATC